MKVILDAMLQCLHHLAYVQDRKLSAVEPIIFLYSSIVPLAGFFNRSGLTFKSVVAFWKFIEDEWPVKVEFVKEALDPEEMRIMIESVVTIGRMICLWAVDGEGTSSEPKRPDHWQVFNLKDTAHFASPRSHEPGSFNNGGLFAHLSLTDPFCKELHQRFVETIESRVKHDLPRTMEHVPRANPV